MCDLGKWCWRCLQVLVLEFNEETNELSCDHSFSQPGEVWSVSPSPRDASLLFTSHGSPGKHFLQWGRGEGRQTERVDRKKSGGTTIEQSVGTLRKTNQQADDDQPFRSDGV